MTDREKSLNPDSNRYEYLLECYRRASEQIIHHSTQRSSMMKLQLLTQASLLALALGFSIGPVQGTPEGLIDLLLLAFPASTIFTSLYVVEDRLLVLFCRYVGDLSERERLLAGAAHNDLIKNSEVSDQMSEFTKIPLAIRFFAQLVAFLLIPSALSAFKYTHSNNSIHCAEMSMDIVLFISILAMLLWAFVKHRGDSSPGDKRNIAA